MKSRESLASRGILMPRLHSRCKHSRTRASRFALFNEEKKVSAELAFVSFRDDARTRWPARSPRATDALVPPSGREKPPFLFFFPPFFAAAAHAATAAGWTILLGRWIIGRLIATIPRDRGGHVTLRDLALRLVRALLPLFALSAFPREYGFAL